MFTDFQFGDNFASDFGLMVATFDSSGGVETVSSGSTLTFNTVKSVGQDISELYGSTYDEDYSFTIQLCRLDNHCNPIPLMPEEYGAINRWLNRKTFDQFKINKEGYENIRFYGTFNVQAVKINEDIYGIECTFTSNAPYGFAKERTHTFSNVKSFYIYDDSDEVGEIYPYTVITCNEAGTLTLTNSADNELCQINNCTKGEIITIDNKHRIITSNNLNHKIANDFNYNFIKLINTYKNRDNYYSSTLNINVIMTYFPVRKVGI
jgi:hypothetical protein